MNPQPPPYNVQPEMVVVQQPPAAVVVSGNTNQQIPGAWNTMLGTGVAQIVFGSITIIVGIASIIWAGDITGTPIWSGLGFYCVAGSLGVGAGKRKNKCMAIAYMVMSIMACLASAAVIVNASLVLAYPLRCYPYSDRCSYGAIAAVISILLIVALAELVLAIIGASSTCGAACYTSQPAPVTCYCQQQGQPMVVQAAAPGAQTPLPMVYPSQPGTSAAPIQTIHQPAMPVATPQPGKGPSQEGPENMYQALIQ